MNKNNLRLALLIILFLPPNAISEIIVRTISEEKSIVTILIEGKIKRDDELKFETILDEISSKNQTIKNNSIQLNSRGGNAYAGRAIGMMIREKGLNTYLGAKSRCSSACVDVLVGGNQRVVLGSVRIHRQIAGGNQYDGDYKAWVEKHQQKLYDYYDHMNVSAMMYFAMEATSSWSIRILTKKEIRDWNISGTDEVFDTLWLQNALKVTGLNEGIISNSVYKNHSKCREISHAFKDTYWDCQFKQLKKFR